MLHISFDFNELTKEVSNLKVDTIDTIETTPKQTKSTSKVVKKSKSTESEVVLEENKLVLPQDLLDLLNATPGDRIAIRYGECDGKYYPAIAKSEVFADPDAGNKLTKSCTISYKGKQHDELAIYGTRFKYVETAPGSGICRLIGECGDIESDNTVFKSNQDLEPYDSEPLDKVDNKRDEEKSLNQDQPKTYIPELSKTTDFGLNEEDFDMMKIDIKEMDVLDDLEDFLNSI